MKRLLLGLFFLGIVFPFVATAEDAKDDAIKKDQKLIEGSWQVTSLVINGTKSKDEDVKKLMVVNGSDGTWSVRADGNVVAKGTSTLAPSKKPKTIDFTATEGGGKGDQFRGIYELRKNRRKLCFAGAGKDRPTEFSSTPDNQYILVEFKRMKTQ